MNPLLKLIAQDVNVEYELLSNALAVGKTRYKHFEIKKRNGGKRSIYQPSSEAKLIQYWLMQNVLSELPIHKSAMAFREGCSILDNAKAHRKSQYAVRIDFKDFFPSIQLADLAPLLRGRLNGRLQVIDQDTLEATLSAVSFDKRDRLPIGYPSSPIISNIVMNELDIHIARLAADEKFGHSVVTRYADDIVFSTDIKGACGLFVSAFENLIAATKSPNLTINKEKTRFMSRGNGSMIVTGLKICHDGHITLHKNYKHQVETLLYAFKQGHLSPEDHSPLRGHLAFIESNDGAYFTKLAFKYSTEIGALTSPGLIESAPSITAVEPNGIVDRTKQPVPRLLNSPGN